MVNIIAFAKIENKFAVSIVNMARAKNNKLTAREIYEYHNNMYVHIVCMYNVHLIFYTYSVNMKGVPKKVNRIILNLSL